MTSITKNTAQHLFYNVVLKVSLKHHPERVGLDSNTITKLYFPIAKLVMKIVEYLALFVVEHNIQRAPLHLAHAFLKLMVDLDQLVIVIMAIANHQGLGIPSLQILKSNPEITQSTLWEVKLFIFLLF